MCATNKKVYAFVGIPAAGTMYSQIVNDSGSTIEAELDSMMDLIDCQRLHHPIWMTVPVESASFEQAVAQFAKYMQYKANSK